MPDVENADGNTGASSARVRASYLLEESGSGVDALSSRPQVSLSDTGTGDSSEAESRARNATSPDVGTGVDSEYVFLSGLHARSDYGVGTDSATVGSRLADVGSDTDYVTLIISSGDSALYDYLGITLSSEMSAYESFSADDDSNEQTTDTFLWSELGTISHDITSSDAWSSGELISRPMRGSGYVRASVAPAVPYIITSVTSGHISTTVRKVGKVVDLPIIYESP